MLNIIVFLLLGILVGLITGLLPGLHPNTIAVLLLSISSLLLGFGQIPLLVFLVSLGITNSITDFIPSIILGAPEGANALSALPGHKMLMKGKGFNAIMLTVKGGVYSILFSLILLPLIILGLPLVYNIIKPSLAFVLILLSLSLITMEENKALALLFFILSGILGLVSMNLPIDSRYTLFPLLTGLFGFSLLLNQLRTQSKVPRQSFEYKEKNTKKNALFGTIGGFFSGILPGITPSQIAAFLNKENKEFLTIVGAITTTNILISFLAIKLISHPRSGIAVVLQQLMKIGYNEILIIIPVSIVSVTFASLSTISLSKIILKNIHKINYQALSYVVLIILNIGIFLATGIFGLFIAWTAALIGLSSLLYKIRRYTLMGSLIIPSILFYLGINTAFLF